MMIKNSENGRVKLARTGRSMLLPLFFSLIFAAAFSPSRTQAQIIGNLAAEIPFQFHVGNTTLPAGKYIIHQLEGSELTMMQISTADGKLSALFNVESAEAKTTPEKSELIFNKYGDQYFLSELFDEGTVDGSKLLESRDERKASKESGADVAHVAAVHPLQEGK
jgi:hypothetical protein